jgi:DNA-binding NarL/FixJ family response regulator
VAWPPAVPTSDHLRTVAVHAAGDSDEDLIATLEARGWSVVPDAPDADVIVFKADRPAVIRETADDLVRLAAGKPVVAVLNDAAAGDRAFVRDLVARGIGGVVATSRVRDALTATVDAALAGQIVLPGGLAGTRRPMLTVREKQVLGMVVLGFTNGEIAAKLYIAETTVKSHLSSAFAKLDVRSRSEAVDAILDPINGLGTGILEIVGNESQLRPASQAISRP